MNAPVAELVPLLFGFLNSTVRNGLGPHLARPSDGSSNQPYRRAVARIAFTSPRRSLTHSLGVLHHDIKPSNLLLDTCGSVWVTDFGLAKVDSGSSSGHDRTSDDAGAILDITQSGGSNLGQAWRDCAGPTTPSRSTSREVS